MERYICIHGHFYQPPRENPWLETIEAQDTAYPYHDWNERITAECYEPNTESRILDGENLIVQIVNNFEKISFNFGPTLLSWLENKAPRVYESVLAADRASMKRFSGHGSALAQAYNHMILPLANRRDKETQILWGIADFERRFGRRPEGMWLPETAADLESLDLMAEQGIRFTVLSPYQADRTRQQAGRWRNVSGGGIDPTRAYMCPLPSGRRIHLFFYDGPISQAVAFEDLLAQGERLANRLVGAFSETRDWPQLVHIATDGETYGHHHRFGDMALAYALQFIEEQGVATLTNYGDYLEKNPADHFVEIHENSSWSCVHGVERWRRDCGCHTGGRAHWNQAWRAPLREALDWLRDEMSPKFEERCRQVLRDPWAARNDYIHVVLNRSSKNVAGFFDRNTLRELSDEEKTATLKLLELQRQAMLMYTSCGWFFDELSGIETVQVIRYAGRAIQLAQELFGNDIELHFLDRLEKAKSNIPERGDGRSVYEKARSSRGRRYGEGGGPLLHQLALRVLPRRDTHGQLPNPQAGFPSLGGGAVEAGDWKGQGPFGRSPSSPPTSAMEPFTSAVTTSPAVYDPSSVRRPSRSFAWTSRPPLSRGIFPPSFACSTLASASRPIPSVLFSATSKEES